MNRLWVIGDSKKVLFPGKSVFIFLLSYFCTLFSKNCLFATRPPFLTRWYLINGSFLRKVTFHMVNVKRVVLLVVIWVKCLYLTSPIFNSSAKSNRLFLLQTRKYFLCGWQTASIRHFFVKKKDKGFAEIPFIECQTLQSRTRKLC